MSTKRKQKLSRRASIVGKNKNNRKFPPCHPKDCKNQHKRGKDGRMYISKRIAQGQFKWVVATGKLKTVKKTSTIIRPRFIRSKKKSLKHSSTSSKKKKKKENIYGKIPKKITVFRLVIVLANGIVKIQSNSKVHLSKHEIGNQVKLWISQDATNEKKFHHLISEKKEQDEFIEVIVALTYRRTKKISR